MRLRDSRHGLGGRCITHSWFYSPLACAVVGRDDPAIPSLQAAFGHDQWDHIVDAYRVALQEKYPLLLDTKTAEINRLRPNWRGQLHVDDETQNELFRLPSVNAAHGVHYATFTHMGNEELMIGKFLQENYHRRHEFTG